MNKTVVLHKTALVNFPMETTVDKAQCALYKPYYNNSHLEMVVCKKALQPHNKRSKILFADISLQMG